MPEISIIVPAYNVEKYILRSMKYIQQQTFHDFEVILVDDGSSDQTSKICDEFALTDNRFKVFHKSNGGVSDARNYGLDRMSGKYMTFIDSDDWVTADYLEYLYNLVTLERDIDIAMTVGCEIVDTSNPVDFPEMCHEIIDAETAVKKMLLRKKYRHANWGKIYKAEIWNDVRFPVSVIYDDYDTTYRAFSKSKKVVCGDAIKYSYVQREGSLMHVKCSEKTLSVLDVADNITKFIIEKWPNCKIEAVDMQMATYLKNLQAILNDDKNCFLIYQKRIIDAVKRNAPLLLLSKRVPLRDKVKILVLLMNRNLFVKLYNKHDGNMEVK